MRTGAVRVEGLRTAGQRLGTAVVELRKKVTRGWAGMPVDTSVTPMDFLIGDGEDDQLGKIDYMGTGLDDEIVLRW